MTDVTHEQRRLLTLCALRLDDEGLDWSLLAREATRPEGLDRLYAGEIAESSKPATAARELLVRIEEGIDAASKRVDEELEAAETVNARLVTVLDEDYPANLQLIYNLPPFLFVQGDGLTQNGGPVFDDFRSVCVVGTRKPSEQGFDQARDMTRRLAEVGVVVVSGLARGIDTAAHRSAIEYGGRTLAVIGSGITRIYPPENKALAEEVRDSCAVVSQFWPKAHPTRWTFPLRNIVMSGIAQGTVVVEASATSGAKMQARLALEHGKRVFLLRDLVTEQDWARKYLKKDAVEVKDATEVVEALFDPKRVKRLADQRREIAQLALNIA